jgi:hypothetical protein
MLIKVTECGRGKEERPNGQENEREPSTLTYRCQEEHEFANCNGEKANRTQPNRDSIHVDGLCLPICA